MNRKQTNILIGLGLIILCFVIYSNVINGEFLFDDRAHLIPGQELKSIDEFLQLENWLNINERPLSVFTFALNNKMNGLDVRVYHITNIIIHLLSALFVYLLSRMIFLQSRSRKIIKESSLLAFFVCLIFLVHPLQTQSVSYIIQRMTSLAGMFYLGAVYFYFYGRWIQRNKPFIKAALFYGLTIISGIAAILSKQNAASLPLALLIIELFFIRNNDGKVFKKYIICYSSLLLISFIIVVFGNYLPKETEDISRVDYLITQFGVIAKYFQLMLLPIKLNLDYDWEVVASVFGWKEFLGLILIVGIIYIIKSQYKKRPIVSFGLLWIFVTLSIESSIIPIRDVIFEHRLYLPLFGFSILLVSVIFNNTKTLKQFIIFMLLLVLLLSIRTYLRNEVWRTTKSLWEDVVRKSPNKARPHLMLGSYYFQQTNIPKAAYHLNKVLEIDPENWEGYFNRAEMYLYMNKPGKAIFDYNKAIEINPDFPEIYDSRGLAKLWLKKYDEAILDFNEALKLNPHLESAYFNRANAYVFKKMNVKAMSDYNKSIQVKPDFAEAYNNRARLSIKMEEYEKAMKDINQAIKLKSNFENAYINRAKLWMHLKEYVKAIGDLEKTMALNPKNSEAFELRARCFYELGKFEFSYRDLMKAKNLGAEIDIHLMQSVMNEINSKKLTK